MRWKNKTRVMSRIKAVYRNSAIPCAGLNGVSTTPWCRMVDQVVEPGVRLTAEQLYQQLDALEPLAGGATRSLAESRKRPAVKLRVRLLIWADSFRVAGGAARDAIVFAQATVVAYGGSDWRPRQRRIPLCERATATEPRASHRSGPERKP